MAKFVDFAHKLSSGLSRIFKKSLVNKPFLNKLIIKLPLGSSIRSKIILSFSFVLFISGGLATYSILNIEKANKLAEELILEESKELILLQDLRFNMSERLGLVNNYLLDGSPQSKEKFELNIKNNKVLEEKLFTLVYGDNSEKKIEKIISNGLKWNDIMVKDVIQVYDQGDTRQALLNLGSEQYKAEQTMLDLKALAEEKQKRVDELGTEIITNGTKVSTMTMILTTIGVILSVLVAFLLSRSIYLPISRLSTRIKEVAEGDFSKPNMDVTSKDELGELTNTFNKMVIDLRYLIKQASITTAQVSASTEELTASSEEITRATEQITGSIQEVAATSNRQLDSIHDTLQTVDELTDSLETLTTSINELDSTARSVADLSISGNGVVENAVSQMTLINNSVIDVSSVIETLGTRSKEISQITDAITSIAEQTNLLALNAAIEAARAGEHGKGFAVVADEVRKLAVQSKDSSSKIVHLITQIQVDTQNAIDAMNRNTKEVESGTHAVNEAGLSFKDISHSINDIRKTINDINEFVESMSLSSEKVSTNVEMLTEIAKTNSTYSHSVASSAEEQLATYEEMERSTQKVNDFALNLKAVLIKFKI
ncbi:methyl-accepting chemotaxis protein [Cytobacillus sp. FJAT-54145]|uniref:Methyl-accepting chemotaxis protein n=1 Tax=Cytobacillus spartinae TaxID=3299023 RepID=A0ABW6KG03_9BACI